MIALLQAILPLRAQEASEARLKGAFIFTFARFTDWPAEAFAFPDSPVVIGVLDDASFARALEETVSGKLINGRSIRVKQISSDADLKSRIHILYFSCNSDKGVTSVLTSLAGVSVLTVGESDQFARAGGMIRFFVQESHIRFEINPDSADRAHLKLSARLLALARIVRGTSAGR